MADAQAAEEIPGPADAPPAPAPLRAVSRALAIAGGLLMLLVSAIVVVSVLMRWLINQSVPGDIELVQIGTALAVFAFLPFCQAQRGNIMVDTFTAWMPLRAQRALDALWDIVYAVMAGIIAWRMAAGAWDTIRSNTVSMMLGLPIGWAIALCAAMAVLLVAVSLSTAFALLRARR